MLKQACAQYQVREQFSRDTIVAVKRALSPRNNVD